MSGAATTHNLSFSTDDGVTWNPGEPPNASPAGTKLRWDVTQPYWANVESDPYDNVTENAMVSQTSSQPCLTFNTKYNQPSLTYSDYARDGKNYDIVNTTWNDNGWIGANGLPYNFATTENGSVNPEATESDGASLAFDLNNRPCIAWGEKID